VTVSPPDSMSTSSTSAAFNEAVSYLSSASAPSQVSNATKLELYGLFKFLTVAPKPSTQRPSIFDLTGKAKWDAWNDVSKRFANGSGPEEAEKRYITIARSLGWREGAAMTQKPDSDNSEAEGQLKGVGSGDGGGMGIAVSKISPPEDDEDDKDSIHAAAISGNVSKLTSLLKKNFHINVNQRDDYGYTALHLGCDRGNVEIVKLLLKHNAETSIMDPDGMTALELARTVGHDEIVALLTNDR